MSEQLAQAREKLSWIGVTSKEVAKCLGQLFALHDPDLQVLVTCVFEALASGHTAWDLELGPVDHLGSSEGAVVADLAELQQAWEWIDNEAALPPPHPTAWQALCETLLKSSPRPQTTQGN